MGVAHSYCYELLSVCIHAMHIIKNPWECNSDSCHICGIPKMCYLFLQLYHAVVVLAKADQQLTVVMKGDDPPPHPSTGQDKPDAGTHQGPVGNGEYINFMVILMRERNL